ncbi:MAG TPA: hypothetical protein VL484_02930 [Vicinamibacterales bacterium]|nr:hypothetical protein [Vicinamibacterales bacterium]
MSAEQGTSADSAPPPRQRRTVLRTPEDWTDAVLESAVSVFTGAKHIEQSQLERLAALPNLATLELAGIRRSIAPLTSSRSLRELRLTDPATLDGVERLVDIDSLQIYCLPKIHSLEPLRPLSRLRRLLLSTPPSYDASRKCHRVESLGPLANLTSLEWLLMRGILPERDRLEPLHALKQLASLEISHVFAFAIEDYARLSRALPETDGRALRPYSPAPWAGPCSKCGGERVELTGPRPRSPRSLCPVCQGQQLLNHVARWDAAKNAAR